MGSGELSELGYGGHRAILRVSWIALFWRGYLVGHRTRVERHREHWCLVFYSFLVHALVSLVVGLDAQISILRGDWRAGYLPVAGIQALTSQYSRPGHCGAGMKNVSLTAGTAVIVIANAFALIHATRNRLGTADAELTLTNRELSFSRSASEDDSGMTLNLRWTTLGNDFSLYGNASPNWLDREKLQALGFDCSVSPNGHDAVRFYQRQKQRETFVALEYDGPAWRAWLDAYHNAAAQQAKSGSAMRDSSGDQSRLVPIDAGFNAEALRVRYPNRSSVIILPAAVSLALVPYTDPERKPDTQSAKRLEGSIQQLASSIHVPRPFSDEFLRRYRPQENITGYSVSLRYGALHEPWVLNVEFAKP